MKSNRRRHRAGWPALLLTCLPGALVAHGGVVAEDDLCVIRIGYLEAHFKIFVPAETGHREYCEDIPVRGESVFVMEYLHDGLGELPIAFRIIRNTTGKGIYARQADVDALPDLDAVTVRYQPPSVVPDVYMLLQDFRDDGEFIGIVTAGGVHDANAYTAVFPFAVGGAGLGAWPWILAALLMLQLNFWFWRRRRPAVVAAGIALTVLLPAPAALQAETIRSEAGHYSVDYRASLDPIVINRMHHWDLVVRDAGGAPVVNARIEVAGGMPAHPHGLATAPQVSGSDVPVHYRIDGLRFHMPGDWILEVTIDDGTDEDVVRIPLTL
jgi:hypothetical protein